MIQSLPILSGAECRIIRDRIYDLRRFWIQRHIFLPFYTLGATSYLDSTTEISEAEGYYAAAKRMNPMLTEHFGWLYDRLSETLAAALEAPVLPQDGFALPGFHLFLAEKLFEDPTMAAAHFDQQYSRLAWRNSEQIDFANPVSFTLAISMPSSGGGMYVWDMWLKETEGLSEEEVEQLRSTRTKTYHEYTVGNLFVHSGHFLHKIAPYFNAQPDDERFTLQGHALRQADGWHYYW